MKWYHKALLSYLPFFVIVASFLYFVFFHLLAVQSKQQTVLANETLNRQVQQTLDYTLRNIDHAMINELLTSTKIYSFFNTVGLNDTYVNYQNVENLIMFRTNHPLVDSLYLVRLKDGLVLSPNVIAPIDRYGDEAYIRNLTSGKLVFGWTDQREFSEFADNPKTNVVTLTRYAEIINGQSGMMVVNVRTDKLMTFLQEMYNPNVSFVHIRDRAGEAWSDVGAAEVLSAITSKYTGWTVESGIVPIQISTWFLFDVFTLWTAISILTIILGVLWIIFITGRNYKPIEKIYSRVKGVSGHPSTLLKRPSANEFDFLEKAFDRMMEQSLQFEEQNQDYVFTKQKEFFYEWLEGKHSTLADPEDWEKRMKELKIPVDLRPTIASIVEIDQYGQFSARYGKRDRNLLRFALENVLQEFAGQERLILWMEWISPQRIACLYQMEASGQNPQLYEITRRQSHKFVEWVAGHLHFTVTVGLGESREHPAEAPDSYKQAQMSLDYKISKGSSRVIESKEVEHKEYVELFESLERIRRLVLAFRASDAGWRQQLKELIAVIQLNEYSNSDITNLMNYLLFQLERQLKSMFSPETDFRGEVWNEFNDKLGEHVSLAVLESAMHGLFEHMERQFRTYQEDHSSYILMQKVKACIETEYMDGNLSLVYLSDKFNVSVKYLSRMFKEHFGIKFVDFLIEIRMKHARDMLKQSGATIQEIAEKFGYASPISFSRTFKKLYGISPGELRKEDDWHK